MIDFVKKNGVQFGTYRIIDEMTKRTVKRKVYQLEKQGRLEALLKYIVKKKAHFLTRSFHCLFFNFIFPLLNIIRPFNLSYRAYRGYSSPKKTITEGIFSITGIKSAKNDFNVSVK